MRFSLLTSSASNFYSHLPDVRLYSNQEGKSALQLWGTYWHDIRPDAVVEDEDKEAFKAHMEALWCSDVL